ncbi:MAG TPA: hypothetical protein VFV38_08685, partial [Ktedonobacteraceae bacterium]|nr:hypothetical protein [Ktedonobacteraceae bacterium]
YLQMQQPELAPDIVREAIGLLRDSFFQPQNHRIPGASEPVEHNNFLSTFKLIDFNLQGDSGDSVVEATYPKPRAWSDNEVYLTAEERRKEPSMPLERGITELLPGNVTYRLRIRNESHWTPIPPDGASTYLYPDQQAGASSLRDNKGREYSLKRLRDSLMGIPSSLEALYEGLYYFKPRSLAAQVFRYHEEDPRWVYDAVNKMALPASSADPRRNRNLRHLDTHSQAFASSIVVPFRPAHAQPSQKIRPPKQLDQIFALINAYLNEDIGYLQLFYEYTISPRLKKSGPGDQLDTRPKLRRLFYGSDSSPERRVPRMAAYEIHTQGLEFIVSEEFCRKVVLRALSSEELRLHYRQRYVAYRLAKNAQFIDQTVLPSSYIELGRMIVAYWLAHHVPANRGDTGKWILSEIDLPAIQAFVEGSESFLAQWCGGQQWSTLFRNIERRDGGVGRFFDEVNRALQEGFTESRPFREYLESVVLHSLAAVVKNHCALLGGVSPESLVVYVDLPGMERVSQPEQPRILVLDSVSGGSGAIGQAFENLTRRPQRTSAAKNSEERNLWALLQTGLGTCPVGDGEMLLRRFLLSMEYREAIAFIEAVRSADDLEGPAQLRAAVEKAGLPIPDEATFETVARTIFAGEVYIASNARRNGSPDAAEELRMSIQPPLIVHELLRQEDRLEKQLGYRPQPEIVVARVLSTMNSGTWPCIERMQQAIRSDLATNRAVAEREKPGRLRAQMTTQLLGLLPRHCEDGCPVCLVSGSNTEISQLAPYMNSRRLLRQVHEILLVDSVQRSDQPVRDLMESKSVRLSGERRLPGDLDTSAGTLKANTFFDTRQKPDTTLIPAVSIDAHGNNRYLSLLKGNPINSREEAVIANYLDVRSKRDGWLYEYNPLRTFRDPQTREDVHLRPNFFVQVPYTVNGEEGMQEMIVEFIAREDLEGYRAVMEIKMRCYRRARKPCIPIKPEDLNEYTFVHKLEEFVREEILKQEQEAFVSFSSLSDLLPIAD